MRAAIYARKSTDQTGVAADQRSVARQIAQSNAFAAQYGWTVDDAHVYVDDGISGALFGNRRPALYRLLNALSPRPPFDVLIMSEESRLGREMTQTSAIFSQIVRAGVRVFFYLTGQERTLDTAMDKIMLSLVTFTAEMEREKARQRVRDAFVRKAQAGHVVGGRVFGYDNVRTDGHVERQINPAEAAVVRRIFELASQGGGLKAIAHQLNAAGCPTPRAQQDRLRGWAPSSVREILQRSIYRGVIEWDRFRRDGERRQLKAHANPTPMQIAAPQLRIVPVTLAAAVDARRAQHATRAYVTSPPARRYLLSGLLRCVCGSTCEAQAYAHGTRPGNVYLCSAARRKGQAVCASTVRIPMARADADILDAVDALLEPAIFDEIIEEALEELAKDDAGRASLERERVKIERELLNLTAAVANGAGQVVTLAREMRQRETRLRAITDHLTMPRLSPRALQQQVRATVAGWKDGLRSSPQHGHQILRILLRGRIQLSHETPQGIPWRAATDLSGLIPLVHWVSSPEGFATNGPAYSPDISGLWVAA